MPSQFHLTSLRSPEVILTKNSTDLFSVIVLSAGEGSTKSISGVGSNNLTCL